LAQTAEAKNAIEQIGTNAVPYLLRWVRYEIPPWKARVYEAGNTVLARLNRSFRFNDDKNVRLARGAVNALIALGRKAESAAEELTQLRDGPAGTASGARAAIALGAFKYPFSGEGRLFVAVAGEISAMYGVSPESHPSFSFVIVHPQARTNAYPSSPARVKNHLGPVSQWHEVMTFVSAPTNPPFSILRPPKAVPTNMVIATNIATSVWQKKSWY
jgi:hypothetical protein